MRQITFYQPIRFSEHDRKPGENFTNHFIPMLVNDIYQIYNFVSGFTGSNLGNVFDVKGDDIKNYLLARLQNFKTTHCAIQEFKIVSTVYDETLLEVCTDTVIYDGFGAAFNLIDKKYYNRFSWAALPLKVQTTEEVITTKAPEAIEPVVLEKPETKPAQASLTAILNATADDPKFEKFKELCDEIATLGVKVTQDINQLQELINIPAGEITNYYIQNYTMLSFHFEDVIKRAEFVIEKLNAVLQLRAAGTLPVKTSSAEYKPEPKPEVAEVKPKVTPETIRKSALCDRFNRMYELLEVKDNAQLASMSGISFAIIRSITGNKIDEVSEKELIDAVGNMDKLYKASKPDEKAQQALEEKKKKMTEVKNLLPLIATGLSQREYANMLGCRPDQISMINVGRHSHLRTETLDAVHAKALELVKLKNAQMAKEALGEAKKIEKARQVQQELIEEEEKVNTPPDKQKLVNELRAMFIRLDKKTEELADILGVDREIVTSVYSNNLDALEISLVETMVAYLKAEMDNLLKEPVKEPTEVVKDIKDLDALKDLAPKATEVKGMHPTGVVIPQFTRMYIDTARDTVKKNYTNTKSAALDIHRRYFNSNKRSFSIISSNPNQITKLCGIDFQITKNIWLPAAKPTPETMLALHLYLEDIQSTLKEIEEKSTETI